LLSLQGAVTFLSFMAFGSVPLISFIAFSQLDGLGARGLFAVCTVFSGAYASHHHIMRRLPRIPSIHDVRSLIYVFARTPTSGIAIFMLGVVKVRLVLCYCDSASASKYTNFFCASLNCTYVTRQGMVTQANVFWSGASMLLSGGLAALASYMLGSETYVQFHRLSSVGFQ
jgi:hypothetical protein